DDDAWAALRSGELEARAYCVGRIDFGPIPLSPLVLVDMDKHAVFANCQIEIQDMDTRRRREIRWRIPVPHWVFVTRASLEKFEKRNPSSAGAEKGAIRDLAARLKANPDMSRDNAWEHTKGLA